MAKSRVANPFEDTTRTSPAPGPQPGEGNAAYLVVLAGSNVGEMYKVEERTVMGRGESAHIRLFDEGISREHAQVVQEPAADGAEEDKQKILLGSTTILKFSYQDKLDEMFQRQMSESALRDGLTKAFNKRYFTERLESEYLYAVRHDAPMTLLFL